MSWKSWFSGLITKVFTSTANTAIDQVASGSGGKKIGEESLGAAIGEAIGHVVTEPMPIFDDFFARYERHFGTPNHTKRAGLEFLLGKLRGDPNMTDVRYQSYVLATVKHECADTWLPIEEYGQGKGRPYGVAIDGHVYYGRGYVQLTWIDNYRKLGREIGEDLVREPWRALEPNAAYRILSIGMVRGLFTNNALSAFINPAGCDYVNARRIVNGLDKADLIAGYAVRLEDCLRG